MNPNQNNQDGTSGYDSSDVKNADSYTPTTGIVSAPTEVSADYAHHSPTIFRLTIWIVSVIAGLTLLGVLILIFG